MKKTTMKGFYFGALVAVTAGMTIGACSGTSGNPIGGGGPDGSSGGSGKCASDADCAASMPATTPPGCAVGKCDALQGTCSYVAADADGDGHTAAACTVAGSGAVQPGDDCNDNDPNLYPGHPENCSAQEDGTAIVWPTGKPVGACQYGQVSCKADGTVSACVGAKSPQKRDCSSSLDNDCDGKPDNTADAVCACTPNQTYDCATAADGTPITFPSGSWAAGTPAPGSVCKLGTALCGADGRLEACGGAAGPNKRNCASADDNDCDGIKDNVDPACECSSLPDGGGGGITQGTTRPCGAHPGKDGNGSVCHAGTQVCNVTPGDPTTAGWSNPGCTDSVGPGVANCGTSDTTLDNDCDGIKDHLEYQSCGTKTAPLSTDGTTCQAQQCESNGGTCAVISTTNSSYYYDGDGDGYCGPTEQSVNCSDIVYDAHHRQTCAGADACDNAPGHIALGGGCSSLGDCCPASAGGVTLSCAVSCRTCSNLGSSCTAGSDGCCGGTKCNGSNVCQTCGGAGAACTTAADCCTGKSCISGVCQTAASCRAIGQTCTATLHCCSDGDCEGGKCVSL